MNFDSLNTTGGHIFVCLLIALGGGVLMWMGRSEQAVFGIGIGLLNTGIGVAFRCMGVPTTSSLPPNMPSLPQQSPQSRS